MLIIIYTTYIVNTSAYKGGQKMKIKVSDYLIKKLENLGIKDIFGLPGDYNFNILDAVIQNPDTNWINCTNELNAAYAADGYSRINGFGAIVTTFGVGELSAINGVAGAYAENVPLIKIAGVPKTSAINLNLPLHHNFAKPDYYAFERIYSNVCATTTFLTEDNAKEEIDRVIDVMVQTRKPVYIALPVDVCNHLINIEGVQEISKIKSDKENLDAALSKITELINNSKNPLIITDYLIKRFRLQNEVREFIDKFNIKITSMIMGKGVINEDDPYYIGINHGKISDEDFIKNYNNSDLILCFGTLFSDLNTLGFIVKKDERFRVEIQADYVIIDDEKFENIFMDEIIQGLLNSNIIPKKISPVPIQMGYKDIKTSNDPILTDEIFPLLQNFLKNDDTIVIETGIISFASSKMKLKVNSNYISQTMWGSIGWATPASFGAAIADRTKRPILFTGEGSHQLTMQEIANMFKYDIKPVILLLNNSGYTIERYLSNNPDDIFNDITKWDYKKELELFSGGKKFEYFSVKTSNELQNALNKAQEMQKQGLVFIEIFTDKMDIPDAMRRAIEFVKR